MFKICQIVKVSTKNRAQFGAHIKLFLQVNFFKLICKSNCAQKTL
nr:MAG TPA: hypothetical protein [Caudoviricetes sp.]